MSTLAEKIDKQFEYQRTRYATSKNRTDLFVSVEHLAGLLASQTRRPVSQLRSLIKPQLEQRADAGQLRRWADVHGPSSRVIRLDHYYIAFQEQERS